MAPRVPERLWQVIDWYVASERSVRAHRDRVRRSNPWKPGTTPPSRRVRIHPKWLTRGKEPTNE